ncbi:MAG: SPFH domain-containing protein [Sedimentisphaerales bacterium]|jgi:membrane protease subunit HflK
MAEENKKSNKDLQPLTPDKSGTEDLDAAGKSLSEALRISFIILKVIMIVLILAFLVSGFKTVESDEEALVLRFGKIRGVGEDRVLKPRTIPYWIFPYPVDVMVKIPVEKKVDLIDRSFWYYQSQERMLGEPSIEKTRILPELDPIKDGYSITRSERQDEIASASGGSDYNIVHCKWRLTYQIDDPELFFKNVYVRDAKPGDIYFDVITKSITPLLQNLFEDAIVTATVNYSIDDVLFEQVARLTEHIRKLLQEKLNEIESGIKVVQVQLTDKTWPRQVNEAFEASHSASQKSEQAISKARTDAENTIIEASSLAQEKTAEARAYRTKVVADARANAEYFQELLPEYRKHPKLVIQKIYQDAIENIFDNAVEKFVIPTGAEWRININRDPSLKPKTGKEQTTQKD